MANPSRRIGVLLLNLGTPDSPAVTDVRRYLREFLGDPRVISIPAPLRWLLLNLVILPFRPRRSAAAYRSIWTAEGSPLLRYGRELAAASGETLGEGFRVELAMRYGQPSVAQGVEALLAARPTQIVVLPLFPQYAQASTGSAIAEVGRVVSSLTNPPPVQVVGPFFEHPAFCDAVAAVAREPLANFKPDHVIMSFHGLPEQQVRDLDPTGAHCLAKPDCCDRPCAANRSCYRAQCFATARVLRAALELDEANSSIVFQSRLGRTRWLEPDLVNLLPDLAARGIRRPAVLCPAFVADCLETVEEVGIRARAQWSELGGEALCLVPCVNAEPAWAQGV
ncbi:MAG: ferrochelatase, partial [bacterium]|nr:ferrochelatase [bacterium]